MNKKTCDNMSQKLSREDLLELVEAIISEYDKNTKKELTEEEHAALVVKFKKGINHKRGSGLIYYSEDVGLSSDPTVEEIVDLAMKGDT